MIRGDRVELDYAALSPPVIVYAAMTSMQSRSPREVLGLLRGFAEVEQPRWSPARWT